MILIAAAIAIVHGPATQETVPYVVRGGDTLEGLTRAYLVSTVHWRDLQRLAKVRDPRRLPIHRRLAIPRHWLRYLPEAARLVSFRGTVSVKSGARPITATVGTRVEEGMELTTGANSFVTMMLSNGSKLVIPSLSRIKLSTLRRIVLTGATDYHIQVLDGRIETKVSPLKNPAARYRIGTPVSMTAVRGTEFRVRFRDSSGISATEVLDGRVALGDAKGEREAIVPERYGAIVDRSGQARTLQLLDPPELLNAGKLQADVLVAFEAKPIPAATGYRAVVAADAGFIENLAEQVSTENRFSFPEIPNGTLFVRVSALDPNGVEGLAQSYSFRRVLAAINAEAIEVDGAFRFRWSDVGEGPRHYRFQLIGGAPGNLPIIDEPGLIQRTLLIRDLANGTYYWRVGVTQHGQDGEVENWGEFQKLTITGSKGGS